MSNDETSQSGEGESRPSPSRRRRKSGGSKLPKLHKGPQQRVHDKTGEVDQPRPSRRRPGSRPRRGKHVGYRGPNPRQ